MKTSSNIKISWLICDPPAWTRMQHMWYQAPLLSPLKLSALKFNDHIGAAHAELQQPPHHQGVPSFSTPVLKTNWCRIIKCSCELISSNPCKSEQNVRGRLLRGLPRKNTNTTLQHGEGGMELERELGVLMVGQRVVLLPVGSIPSCGTYVGFNSINISKNELRVVVWRESSHVEYFNDHFRPLGISKIKENWILNIKINRVSRWEVSLVGWGADMESFEI